MILEGEDQTITTTMTKADMKKMIVDLVKEIKTFNQVWNPDKKMFPNTKVEDTQFSYKEIILNLKY